MSRYHVAGEAVRGAAQLNERIALRSMDLGGELQGRIKSDQKYILEYGTGEFCPFLDFGFLSFCLLRLCFFVDPAGTYDVPTFN